MTAATIDAKYIPSDAELYDYKNLSDEDKATANLILSMRNELTVNLVDEFLENAEYGTFTKNIIREQFIPFIEFLREKVLDIAMDFTVDRINSYPVEYYKKATVKLELDESFPVGNKGNLND